MIQIEIIFIIIFLNENLALHRLQLRNILVFLTQRTPTQFVNKLYRLVK